MALKSEKKFIGPFWESGPGTRLPAGSFREFRGQWSDSCNDTFEFSW